MLTSSNPLFEKSSYDEKLMNSSNTGSAAIRRLRNDVTGVKSAVTIYVVAAAQTVI